MSVFDTMFQQSIVQGQERRHAQTFKLAQASLLENYLTGHFYWKGAMYNLLSNKKLNKVLLASRKGSSGLTVSGEVCY